MSYVDSVSNCHGLHKVCPMIAKSNIAIFVMFAGLSGSNIAYSKSVDWVTAYYFDFEIDPYVLYHETDISSHGCIYWVSEKSFKSLLTKQGLLLSYGSSGTKAKIITKDGAIYFIDNDGKVRSGNKYYKIDKAKFVKALVLKKPEVCR